MPKRSWLGMACFVLVTAALAWAQETQPAATVVGLYQPPRQAQPTQAVVHYTLSTVDRDVPLRITFPREGGPYPVLLWLHGAMGSKDGYQPLVTHWAAHGYVVIQPTFGDSATYLDAEERREFGSLRNAVNSPQIQQHWDDRPREVSIIIDRLGELEANLPDLVGKMQKDNLAVGGHSFGAHTSMLIGGVEARALRRTLSFRDDRVRALLLVSPSGSTRLLTTDSFAKLRGPALVVTGDNDASPIRGQEGKTGTWRREVYDHAQAGDLYLLWINGAHHNFGGISGPARWEGAGPPDPAQVQLVAATCLAFLDAYLLQDVQALQYLRGARLENATLNHR